MPALYLLDDLSGVPVSRVGGRAHELGEYHQQHIAVLPTACVPGSTLELIGRANHLTQHLSSLTTDLRFNDPVAQTRLAKQIAHLFESLHLPHELSSALLKTYSSAFGHAMVRILGGNLAVSAIEGKYRFIHGEANLAQSLLQFWGDMTYHTLRYAGREQSISEILYGQPILIQLEPSVVSSGTITSLLPDTGSKSSYFLESRWGSSGPTKDTFSVDARTFVITSRAIGIQVDHTVGSAQGERSVAVPPSLQAFASLPDQLVIALGQATQMIKRRRLDHIQLKWIFDGQQAYVLQVTSYDQPVSPSPQLQLSRSQSRSHTTATKLYISAGNPSKAASLITDQVDGVGVLRSEYTFAALGAHPSHVLKSRGGEHLRKQLLDTIQTFQKVLKGRPLTYRSLNFHSGELSRLAFATNYEPTESNPYLGMRGMVRVERDPALFQLELGVLHQALASSTSPIRLLVPFVRTPAELSLALQFIEKQGLLSFPNFEVWLQLNTPENLLNIHAYPLKNIAGASIQVQTIHALLHGFDPDDPELATHYPVNEEVLLPLIKKTITVFSQPLYAGDTRPRKQTVLHLEQFHQPLVERAIELGISGITVKPAVVSIAKACIMETEALLVRGAR